MADREFDVCNSLMVDIAVNENTGKTCVRLRMRDVSPDKQEVTTLSWYLEPDRADAFAAEIHELASRIRGNLGGSQMKI